ncbi:MAG: hypothetical protein JO283_20265 [Bradyrhizobium sp.]|nr:hypothetical protein [Bradyrhizobium sp.]
MHLAAGTFKIDDGIVYIEKPVTLRGSGMGATRLVKSNGARLGSYMWGPRASELIRIGGMREHEDSAVLAADVEHGATSVHVCSGCGGRFKVGQLVLLDERSGAKWMPERLANFVKAGYHSIWAAPDYRVVWQKHDPEYKYFDHIGAGSYPYNPGTAGCWFSRCDRPTNEIKQVASVNGDWVGFDSPVTISYRVSHEAQLTPRISGPTNAGVEDMSLQGGDNGNLRFETVAYAWAKNVESSLWLGEGIAVNNSFRVQLEHVYVHDAAWPVPGGGGYAISTAWATSEMLVEDSISMLANKVMVARSSGAGSVVAYNYFDKGFIGGNTWVEIGINASHMTGSHHVLFEGNWGFNIDSDNTHGNSIYMVHFRNWATGFRSKFTDYIAKNKVLDDASGCCGPRRAFAPHAYAYWHSAIGNVWGMPGRMKGWRYDCDDWPTDCIYGIGWMDNLGGNDPHVKETTILDGNFDYLTNQVHWAHGPHPLPNSLYLDHKPAFFGNDAWPWVDPTGPQQLHTLPAKARYDAGTP